MEGPVDSESCSAHSRRWSMPNFYIPTSDAKARKAQEALLKHGSPFAWTDSEGVALAKSPSMPPTESVGDAVPSAQLKLVPIDAEHAINTLFLDPPSNSTGRTLVMAHGYGAGLGFFYRNYGLLGQSLVKEGWSVRAFDWLGMGLSSRPRFPSFTGSAEDKAVACEERFVDSLEKWRQAMNIEKMTLMGHSLGGYLSAAYALKHPERVEHLLLVSPAGVPVLPPPEERRRIPSWAENLWKWNFTPQLAVRIMGPFGRSLVSKFQYLEGNEGQAFQDYLYHVTAQPGSGEFALSHLLLPGAWAVRPLHHRLKAMQVPTSFIYGSWDWMDFKSAVKAAPTMNVSSRVVVVEKAGHHLYLDNAPAFHHALLRELKVTEDEHDEVVYMYGVPPSMATPSSQ